MGSLVKQETTATTNGEPLRSSPQWGQPLKGLLITAAVLSSWIQSVSTQSPEMKVEPSPPYGTVGRSITLSILGLSKQPQRYTWFRKTTDDRNRIMTYDVLTRQQTPANGREMVHPNGSLFIPNLTLEDDGKYIVEIFALADGPQKYSLSFSSAYLHVYADSSSRGGVIAGIVMGVLAGVALIGVLIYFLFIRKTGGDLYHGLGSSSTSPEISTESPYQMLDTTRVDVYEKITPLKKPQA
ncbi:LOW QUALITY PROTEIN: carcinoembryonic antigen-related cell adhesion molecule 4-like [Gracilinanus agilis]|uniref:LOW QUALITY PROTEIN: carcinoembryonic antigen-related cell adhesion molecule 4-like n=1 Tax=Gracilinanus agilis TaxID=191870 RepID=UPI001CFD1A82|nr:LOW QUALITY PROTEIN: carcinoembryonic antigen-related cell adhesion molecule 4-like [Gracilinanus agilis]